MQKQAWSASSLPLDEQSVRRQEFPNTAGRIEGLSILIPSGELTGKKYTLIRTANCQLVVYLEWAGSALGMFAVNHSYIYLRD